MPARRVEKERYEHMDLQKILKGLKNCPCGRDHTFDTKVVEIGSGITAETGKILTDAGFPKKVLVVSDRNEWRAANGILESLDKYGFSNIKKKAESMMEAAKAEVPEGVTCSTRVETGIPGSAIASIVEEEKIDMVVMGNSGKGAVSSFVMGSVSQYVIHHVKCPVLVVK